MPREVFDIFLSSTSVDLEQYRAKVSDMIARLRQTTIRMENFGAKPNKPLATCHDEVLRCDALIVIVGHRYGWVPSTKEGGDDVKSITWWEVQWALDAEKPVYVFVADPNAPWTGEREQDRLLDAKTERSFVEIGKAVQRLKEFREFLDANTTRELFCSPDDLASRVATSLHPWLTGQAVAAARASFAAETAQRLAPVASPAAVSGSLAGIDHLYWQEQVHLFSAQRLVEGPGVARLALIAGRANPDHPALAGADIKQFDVRREARESPPDDFTTGLASLLVGPGNASHYRGVAPQAHLLVVQILDDQGVTSLRDVLVALDLAIREGADVICLPLSGWSESVAEETAYKRAADLGVLVVCPAGNNGDDKPTYPAAYPECLSAGAVDHHNFLASFSSFGNWVTTAAPGVDLQAAVGKDIYRKGSGSSFACAILAGITALMVEANPDLTARQAKDILSTVGLPVLTDAPSQTTGGLKVVDASEAVRRARS
jgi:Subtilase family/Domain of unknown function (DUF4062)